MARDNSMPAAIAIMATIAASPIDFARFIGLLVGAKYRMPAKKSASSKSTAIKKAAPVRRGRVAADTSEASPVAGAPERATVAQLISFAAERFAIAELWFGHGTDNAVDEAAELVFFAAGLRHDQADEVYGQRLNRNSWPRRWS